MYDFTEYRYFGITVLRDTGITVFRITEYRYFEPFKTV